MQHLIKVVKRFNSPLRPQTFKSQKVHQVKTKPKIFHVDNFAELISKLVLLFPLYFQMIHKVYIEDSYQFFPWYHSSSAVTNNISHY